MKTIYAFEQWPLDLLVDYVLKVHHRGIREEGPAILDKLLAVAEAHRNDAPNLLKVADHFRNSLYDLDTHCHKEEQVLYPYIMEMWRAHDLGQQVEAFHCGSIQGPIQVMMADHDDELARHARIAELTNNYTAPDEADDDWHEVLGLLRDFRAALEEHTAMENEVVFPMSLKLEQLAVG